MPPEEPRKRQRLDQHRLVFPSDSHIGFDEGAHVYYLKGQPARVSVTGIVAGKFDKFNAPMIASCMMRGKNWSTQQWRKWFYTTILAKLVEIPVRMDDPVSKRLHSDAMDALAGFATRSDPELEWAYRAFEYLARVPHPADGLVRAAHPGGLLRPVLAKICSEEAVGQSEQATVACMDPVYDGRPFLHIIREAIIEGWNANGQEKAREGTRMHALLEAVTNGDEIPSDLEDLRHSPELKQWGKLRTHFDAEGNEIIATEKRLASFYLNIAGTCDYLLAATHQPQGQEGILEVTVGDHKRKLPSTMHTHPAKNRLGIRGDALGKYSLQLSMYAWLLEEAYKGEEFVLFGQTWRRIKVVGLVLSCLHPDQADPVLIPLPYRKRIVEDILMPLRPDPSKGLLGEALV